MMMVTMATVPALLPVELRKMVTNGCWLPFDKTSSRSPAQKITVMPAMKPMQALEKYEMTSDQGIVHEASLAFSAAGEVSNESIFPR